MSAGDALVSGVVITAINAVIGYFGYRGIRGSKALRVPADYGRAWFGVAFFLDTLTFRWSHPHGLHNAFAQWLIVLIAFGGLAYILGWLYAKAFRSTVPDQSAPALRAAQTLSTGLGRVAQATSAHVGEALASGVSVIERHLKKTNSYQNASIDETTAAAIYDAIGQEIESEKRDRATWTQAIAQADGDEKRAIAAYVRMRFARLVADQERARGRPVPQSASLVASSETQSQSPAPIHGPTGASRGGDSANGSALAQVGQISRNASGTPRSMGPREWNNAYAGLRPRIDLGASLEGKEFLEAVARGQMELIRFWLYRNPSLAHCIDIDGNTPLSIAATKGIAAIAQVLLQEGADATFPNWYGDTPLSIARNLSHHSIVAMMESSTSR